MQSHEAAQSGVTSWDRKSRGTKWRTWFKKRWDVVNGEHDDLLLRLASFFRVGKKNLKAKFKKKKDERKIYSLKLSFQKSKRTSLQLQSGVQLHLQNVKWCLSGSGGGWTDAGQFRGMCVSRWFHRSELTATPPAFCWAAEPSVWLNIIFSTSSAHFGLKCYTTARISEGRRGFIRPGERDCIVPHQRDVVVGRKPVRANKWECWFSSFSPDWKKRKTGANQLE